MSTSKTAQRGRSQLRRSAAAAAAALTLPLTLTACGEAAERAAEEAAENAIEDANGGNADVDIDGDEVTIENSDGSVVVGGGDLPEGFPEDAVPLVGEVKSGTAVDTGQGAGWTIGTESDGSVEDVFAEAVAKLEGAGFTNQSTLGGTSANLTGEEYGVVLNVADSGTGSVVAVYVVSETP